MTIGSVLDHEFDSDLEVRYLAQVASIGSLSDDVVGDLIRAQAGIIDASASEAIKQAAELFGLAASAADEPSDLWVSNRLPDALRRMTEGGPRQDNTVDPSEAAVNWVSKIAADLNSAVAGEATSKTLSRLLKEFESIANATMDVTYTSLQSRGHSTSWLTI